MHIAIFIVLSFVSACTGREIIFPAADCSGIFNGNFASCANALTTQLFHMHQWSDGTRDQRCGFPCVSKVKGRFHRWEWVWDGKFQCETIAPGILGTATRYGQKSAIDAAVADFLRKAVTSGHIQPGDVDCSDTSSK